MKRKKWDNLIIPFIVPLVVLILWQYFSSIGVISDRILPSPTDVINKGIKLTQTGELPANILISLRRAVIGFILGGSIGFILGMVNGMFQLFDRVFDTSIQMLRTIPHLSLIPLVILWFGIDEAAKIFLVTIGVLFPIYINTYHGVKQVDPELIEMGKAYGLNRWKLFTEIVFPGALSSILVGVRYALGIMWTSLIVAETISADSGIGYMATNAREFMQMDTIVLCIVIYALLGKFSDVIARMLENRWQKWSIR